MMDYTDIALDVIELIADAGREVTLIVKSETPTNPVKPWDTQGADVTHLATAVFVPVSGTELGRYGVSEDLAARVEEVALLAPIATVDVEQVHQIQDGSKTYSVEWVQTLKPGNTTLLHYIGVKA